MPSLPRVLFTIGYRPKAVPYISALRQCGLDPDCRTVTDEAPVLSEYAGLVLGGGRDVNPRLYGELRLDGTEDPDTSRDDFELSLLGEAIQRKMPVLAICRGMQLLNVHLGGTLHQHVEGHRRVVHEVTIAPESLVARAVGVTQCEVMSRHHQAVKDLARGLSVTAAAPDGTIEAVQMDSHSKLLAVQWHPEDGFEENPHDRRLFEFFAASV
ncbi:MAG: gamma-glutamyl-gamma-aminobutyrate hydrolase family protein [Bryobacteraceae bacterium]|nr:gamma-glutamyl-gamma-aminobutyrate hydrolase family protein [Bryobacteraceae bacterium]